MVGGVKMNGEGIYFICMVSKCMYDTERGGERVWHWSLHYDVVDVHESLEA